ncbi:MAG: hypothetical protein KA254_05560 [Rhodoferax sp.]|nr:hypothetical protein [Rhodoferax sp.]
MDCKTMREWGLRADSGLGLAICEQIARAHHGVIRAAPSPLGGVLFHLELPRLGDESV